MARDEERLVRSQEDPIVGGLPDLPGIRMVEGFRPRTLPGTDAYGSRADEIAAHGYSDRTGGFVAIGYSPISWRCTFRSRSRTPSKSTK